MDAPKTVEVTVGGRAFKGAYVTSGRPVHMKVTCPELGRTKPGSPGSVPHDTYAAIILRQIVNEAIREGGVTLR